ncbi:MAG: lipoyl(octanoyl) transferase LipB [Bacteroidales bacterium]|nr:lipoyl(octanoyl) transferase LipB [Bacteroidales bacterium]MCF8386460.1 lipoyl(octanoyl) transferase LipB [Bacteroidales bacterium]MCF8397796.1 lipoyl(octanoyl) transferase LipB [Bacteroidales bacterium]
MERIKVHFRDLGLIDYKEAWDYQENIFDEILGVKTKNMKQVVEEKHPPENHLLFCEHPHVFTMGKSGNQSNLLINEAVLKQKGASFHKINRGGDITYHGPGQIVGYPIFDLEQFDLGVKEYIFKLEESIILVLKEFDIEASRLQGATGVWLDADDARKARKICAIGVRASRYVTMHGFAFNVNTNLDYYQLINPCGFTDKGVTSMKKELNAIQRFAEVQEVLKNKLSRVFGFRIIEK